MAKRSLALMPVSTMSVFFVFYIFYVNLQIQNVYSMQKQHVGNQLSEFLKSGSLLSILIIMNVGLWVLMLLFPLVDYLYAMPQGSSREGWYGWFALSSQWDVVVRRPWTLLTYMFIHDGFWHILFNMVMLYFGGVMCCRYMSGKRFGWIYFVSGIVGALLYLVVYNLFPVGRMQVSSLVGASAAVLGVFVAVAAYVPDQEVGLWLIRTFSVKMKWLALALVVIDLLSIPASNAGGHIAHLGGALSGWLYVVALRWNNARGHAGHRTVRRASGGRRREGTRRGSTGERPLSDEEYNRRKVENQRRVDEILDKISKYGYDGLSKDEKEFLFKYNDR